MTRSRYQRWTIVLGLVAMLGAVLAVPASALAASSKTLNPAALAPAAVAPAAMTDGDMPCHKRMPGCPDPCPDMASCIVKCLKSQSPLPETVILEAPALQGVPVPAPQAFMEPSDLPRLLRPPIA